MSYVFQYERNYKGDETGLTKYTTYVGLMEESDSSLRLLMVDCVM